MQKSSDYIKGVNDCAKGKVRKQGKGVDYDLGYSAQEAKIKAAQGGSNER